ncbi:MAG TPA: RidA family protein [Acidimicrobiia bacterium]|nr:RidA family protein [Acidimicrobiia bacterium]
MSDHRFLNPEGMPPARGFSHGALPTRDNTLYIAGQTGHHHDSTIDPGLVDQFAQASRSVAAVIAAAGGEPTDLVSLTIYTTDIQGYRDNLGPIGDAYREVFGKHYPPMALIGVAELFDPEALVELVGMAVVPGSSR